MRAVNRLSAQSRHPFPNGSPLARQPVQLHPRHPTSRNDPVKFSTNHYHSSPCSVTVARLEWTTMSWFDAILFEFTRVTWQQWLMTIIGGIGLAWLAVLVKMFRRQK